MYYPQKKFLEKRKGPDVIIKLINLIAISTWTLLFISLILFDKAKPEIQNIFDRLNNFRPLRENWNHELTKIIFVIMIIGFISGIIGIIFNNKRKKRKTDETWISLYFVVIISFLGIIFYLF